MNAKQARDLTTGEIPAKSLKQIKSIETKIQIAAKNGDVSIWWYNSLLAGVEKHLIKNGFKVTNEDDRDGILIGISWAKTEKEVVNE